VTAEVEEVRMGSRSAIELTRLVSESLKATAQAEKVGVTAGA
jgi:hypothetical protein